ncbi:MAG: DUF1571 domain-containing protein [Planctomycetota bacterium]|nr:DUF1571 domain-containing protein [Planctomycetota bacterium]
MRPNRITLSLLLVGLSVLVCAYWGMQRRSSACAIPAPAGAAVATAIPAVREHPLMPALRFAKQAQTEIEKNVRDYTATLLKRERMDGKLGDQQQVLVRIRHQPFSIYVCLVDAAGNKGDEAIYVEGQNDGKLQGHTTGIAGKLLGTISLKPDGPIAMRGQRYPMTETGVLNLCTRLIEVGTKDLQHEECEVTFLKKQKLQDRECTCIEVKHPVRREYFGFHVARIFVDDQWNVPLRYEAYDWPQQAGGEPELLEQYEYRDLKLNCGLTDADFDPKNPEYQFR